MQNQRPTNFRSTKIPSPQKTASSEIWRVICSWIKKDGWAIIGIIGMMGVTSWYFGFHQQHFHIHDVHIEGNKFIHTEDIQHVVDQFTSSKTIIFLKRNTFWTFKAEALEKQLYQSLSSTYALEQVEVQKKFPNSVAITVTERIPSVTWVTTSSGTEHWYTVDREGIVTQVLGSPDQADTSFPIIRDTNRDQFEAGWHIISSQYIDFVLHLHEQMENTTGTHVDSYVLPLMQCQEQQYVTEEIFKQELQNSASDEFRDKKREIQEKFQRGELTVDESLEELEKIKEEEFQQNHEGEDTKGVQGHVEWQTVYVPVTCDFVNVATEVHVMTSGDHAGYQVYMDTSLDLSTQLQNLESVLQEKISDPTAIQYIDVRFADRVYYQ